MGGSVGENRSATLAAETVRFSRLAGLGILLLFAGTFLTFYIHTLRGSRPWIETSFPAISDWNSLKITLSRGPCLGACPVYSVSIDGSGNVIFKAGVWSDPPFGEPRAIYRGHIDQGRVRQLFQAFQEARFFGLYDQYEYGAIDLPEYRIGISFDGHKKEVLDYSGETVDMPPEVTELENLIDRVAGTRKWLASRPETAAPIAPPKITLTPVKAPSQKLPEIVIEEPKSEP